MDLLKEKLLTIITEADIEDNLIEDINRLGAGGYTITHVRGKGEKGIRNAVWNSNSNIKIEIICNTKICDSIVEFIKQNYLKNYALILFISEVSILRSGKN